MKEIKNMLYSMQKFQIMSLFTNPEAENSISPPYAYAWEKGVFPALDEGAEWHRPFIGMFLVQEEMVKELIEFLEERYKKEIAITFYELEEHYGIKGGSSSGDKWDRFTLTHACRYLCMHKKYDENFWKGMMEFGKSPVETKSVTRMYCPEEVSFE